MAIRPVSIDRSVEVVWYGDPAVDEKKSKPLKEYLKAAYSNPQAWRDMLKFKEGATPSVFRIGIIAPGELSAIEDACGLGSTTDIHQLQWRCFLHCVRGISNFPGVEVQKNGKTVSELPMEDGVLGDVKYVQPTWLAGVFVKELRECAKFIGMVAYNWNQMTGDDAKN